jgi:hypothetical protein
MCSWSALTTLLGGNSTRRSTWNELDRGSGRRRLYIMCYFSFVRTHSNRARTSFSFNVADFGSVYLLLIRRRPGKARVWGPTIVQFNLFVCYFVFYMTYCHFFDYRCRQWPSCATTTFEAQRLWSWSWVSPWQDTGLSDYLSVYFCYIYLTTFFFAPSCCTNWFIH